MVHFPEEYIPEDRTVCIHGRKVENIDFDNEHF